MWQSGRMQQTANLHRKAHPFESDHHLQFLNGSEHWYAAGFYKPGRAVRWAATIEFESLRYYHGP
jgi:hypothetical protein